MAACWFRPKEKFHVISVIFKSAGLFFCIFICYVLLNLASFIKQQDQIVREKTWLDYFHALQVATTMNPCYPRYFGLAQPAFQ